MDVSVSYRRLFGYFLVTRKLGTLVSSASEVWALAGLFLSTEILWMTGVCVTLATSATSTDAAILESLMEIPTLEYPEMVAVCSSGEQYSSLVLPKKKHNLKLCFNEKKLKNFGRRYWNRTNDLVDVNDAL